MRYLLALIVLVVGCGACAAATPSPEEPDPLPSAIEAMRETTVGLVFRGPSGSFHIGCAGVWVGASSILTAAHCTEPMDAYGGDAFAFMTYAEVGAHGDAAKRMPPFHYAYVTARDEIADLALLTTERVPHPRAHLSPDDGYSGQPVHLVGHGYGLPYTWAPGVVSSVRDFEDSLEFPARGWFTLVIGESRGGNSGGGLWDEDGRLLGICSQSDRKGFSFYVARRSLATFLAASLVDG